jgi:hypothetical protein
VGQRQVVGVPGHGRKRNRSGPKIRDTVPGMTPDAICGLLAEPERLAAFSAVVLGAGTAEEIANRTGLGGRDVAAAVRRLAAGGLVHAVDGRWRADVAAFKTAVREHAVTPYDAAPHLDGDPARDAVLRAFLRDGRIVQLPAARGKRRVLLEHLVGVFEPGVRYPEREVDALLRAWHDDYVAVRRYLIDEGLMSREAGVYWRTGGPFHPSAT